MTLKRTILLAALLACLAGAVSADSTNTWDFTNENAYVLSDPGVIELDASNSVVQLILQPEDRFSTTFDDYLGAGVERYQVGLGPDVGILLTKTGLTNYSSRGVFRSRVFDGEDGKWQMIHARSTERSVANSSVEVLPTDSGVVGLWHMDGNWNDSKGGMFGIPAGSPTFSTNAVIGSHAGASFAAGNWVEMTGGDMGISDAFTVMLWVRATLTDNVLEKHPVTMGADASQYLAFRVGGSVTYGPTWPSNSIAIRSLNSFGWASTAAGTFTEAQDRNVWRHIVFTYDGTAALANRTHIYKDAVSLPMVTDALAGSASGFDTVRLSRTLDNAAGLFWDGNIDEVAIYNRALTPAEIGLHYNASRLLRLRVRSGADPDLTGPFAGPDGTSNSFYTADHETLVTAGNFNVSNRYAQYEMTMYPFDFYRKTPVVESVGFFGTTGPRFDNTLLDFNAGNFVLNTTNLPASADTPYVALSRRAGGGCFTNGYYESRVFDGSNTVSWESIVWEEPEEVDTNVTGMVGLYHLDGNWSDSAPGGGATTRAPRWRRHGGIMRRSDLALPCSRTACLTLPASGCRESSRYRSG